MHEFLTRLPFDFPGQIYRSPMPFGAFDPQKIVLELYRQAGVELVVMLVSDEEAQDKSGRNLGELYAEQGMQVISLPIPDFDIPKAETLLPALEQVKAAAQAGRNIAVHCNAGIGRTGLFMACLARQVFGMPGAQAIAWVQQYIAHAVENELQVTFVQDLALSTAV